MTKKHITREILIEDEIVAVDYDEQNTYPVYKESFFDTIIDFKLDMDDYIREGGFPFLQHFDHDLWSDFIHEFL
jgi:hypothetical protein